MKKYMLRLLVATLTFSIGTASIYFFAWDKIKILNPYRATHSAENNSPYSVLEGTIIRIKPYNATFETRPTQPHKRQQLLPPEYWSMRWNAAGRTSAANVW